MTEPMHTLVVDDEEGIRFFVERALRSEGHAVVALSSGEEALERLRDEHFELVMLDLHLGGRADGLRVLEAIRWRWPDTIVLILTGHGTLDSAVAAIREGVDGYLLKPIEPEELRRAVREAVERRRRLSDAVETEDEPKLLQRGPFTVDLKKHVVRCSGQPVDLTPREFNLLVLLMDNADRVLAPREIVRAVAGYEADSTHEARQIVKWYVHHLRQKVEPDSSHPTYILNVRGVGYRFGA
jgi:DNA-binding response OmpR family regulator